MKAPRSCPSQSACHRVIIQNSRARPREQESLELSTLVPSSAQGLDAVSESLPVLFPCPGNKAASGLLSNTMGCRTSSWTAPTQADCSAPHFLPRAEGSEAAQLAEIYAKLEEIEADKAPARYLKFPLSSHFTFPFCYLFQLGSSLPGHQSFLLDLALPLKCSSSPPGEWPLPFLTVDTVGSAPVLGRTHLSCGSVCL